VVDLKRKRKDLNVFCFISAGLHIILGTFISLFFIITCVCLCLCYKIRQLKEEAKEGEEARQATGQELKEDPGPQIMVLAEAELVTRVVEGGEGTTPSLNSIKAWGKKITFSPSRKQNDAITAIEILP